MDSVTRVPVPVNEPVRTYAPGSPERHSLLTRLDALALEQPELAATVAGERRPGTGGDVRVVRPDNHRQILARGFAAGPAEADAAVRAATQAAPDWSRLPLDERASVFLRAADLLAEPWRDTLNGATMLGQSKTIHQAEIDSACELADFWRFSVAGARVLVVDDTWTTGAHAQSASCGLKAADAAAVGVLAIGRSFTTDYRDNNSGW